MSYGNAYLTAEAIGARMAVAWQRLKRSLVQETGNRLIRQSDELRKARRQVYWVGSVLYVLLLAQLSVGKANVRLLATLDVPVHPLVIGLTAYLALSMIHFMQEQWRNNRLNVQAGMGQDHGEEVEHTLYEIKDLLADVIKHLQYASKAAARVDSPPDPVPIPVRLRQRIERLEKQTRIARENTGIDKIKFTTGYAREMPFSRVLNSQAQILEEVKELTLAHPRGPAEHTVESLLSSNNATIRNIQKISNEIDARTRQFLSLSTDIKFRDRFFHVFVETSLPMLFGLGAIAFGLNDLYVAASGPLWTIAHPLCPLCPPVAS